MIAWSPRNSIIRASPYVTWCVLKSLLFANHLCLSTPPGPCRECCKLCRIPTSCSLPVLPELPWFFCSKPGREHKPPSCAIAPLPALAAVTPARTHLFFTASPACQTFSKLVAQRCRCLLGLPPLIAFLIFKRPNPKG